VPWPFDSWAFDVGSRYLRAKKSRTVRVIGAVAVSGVALGVASLLAVMSIASGFEAEFRDRVLGVNAHVLVMKYGGDFEEYADVVARALEMPEVAGAAPFLIHEMMLANGDRIGGVLVKGVDPERMAGVLDLPSQLVEGSLEGMRLPSARPPIRVEDDEEDPSERVGEDLDLYLRGVDARYRGEPLPEEPPPEEPDIEPLPEDLPPEALPEVHVPTPAEAAAALAALGLSGETDALPENDPLFHDAAGPDGAGETPLAELPGIVVGYALASRLNVALGDRVRVISPLAGLDTSFFRAAPRTPRSREFRVIGIFRAGFDEYDTHLVFVDLYEAEAFFERGDSVDGVEIRLHDLTQAPAVARRLDRMLGGGPYSTTDWEELNHNLFEALEIQKIMLSLVIASIVVVAAFNVIATLIMIVLERKREIAILKAMGAHDSHVLAVFVVQGLAIGFVGTFLGLILGGGACLWLESYHFPLDPHVYLIDHLPVRTSMVEFGTTVVTALLISIIATLVPSWWAARLLPADGVRHE
jgi:lipoprotein-releasing system permease protein